MIPLRLIGPKVLVALEPKATTREDTTGMHYHDKGRSESGAIILAQPTDMYDADEHSRGLVVALGTKTGTVELEAVKRTLRAGRSLDSLAPAPFEVAVGDVVLFPPSAGTTLGEWDDGITYVALREQDILGILQPKSEAA